MTACDICKVASECAAWQTDERNPEPPMHLSACNYLTADEYIECTGE
jgi:hypothetical protein